MTYAPKRDWWVSGLVVPAAALQVVVGLTLIGAAVAVDQPLLLLVAAVALAAGGLLLWAFFGTSYEVTPEVLRVRFGPLRWRIPVEAVAEVTASNSVFGPPAWGVAWSLDRLFLRYRKRNGKLALLRLAIAPRDQAGFVRELAAAIRTRESAAATQMDLSGESAPRDA
jgi:hypothetical protein